MAFDLPTLLRSVHVLGAGLWFGGAILMAFILGPALKTAGPAAGPFIMTLMRRGGLSPYFMSVGGVTILSGFYLYYAYDYHTAGFSTGTATLITIAALVGILAYADGLFVLMPNERKIKALTKTIAVGSSPTADQGAQLAQMGATQGKHSALSGLLILLAFLLMTASRLF